ncbi:F-box/WD repeat-containing protein pof1-like [Anneissia japonica]|uniref:F-box/WD repeat-containing protein pof1-like n=1 Tax=Anneissia japonica TaxID=1529436 RepID=UPI001425B5C1|nr:F-box/WD repeat-containing protein pof1-like [Anneissia japonica]XP_033101994.1 F-box/WD repeat-containing protein pof1-like [Anneissia japonica]XP_033101995.1 F-box/WD repeat-containing protein pof1-like [Anneissia japonica]
MDKLSTLRTEYEEVDKSWSCFHGKELTADKLEFERQLDHLVLWIDAWSHVQRCTILEGLMSLSNFNQFSFLSTTLLPTLHRDFMYTSKQDFPQNKFTPISTQVSRTKKVRRRLKKYHRLESAHLQARKDIIQCNSLLTPPQSAKEMNADQTHNYKSRWDLPGLTKSTSKLPTIHRGLPMNYKKTQHPLSKSAPAGGVRVNVFPSIRRHVQETQVANNVHSSNLKEIRYEPMVVEERPRLVKSMSAIQLNRTRSSMSGTDPRNLEPVVSKPDEAWQLFHWYTSYWTDVQRNEFLHLLMKRLDARQLYFVSSILALKKYRDFITLLPEDIAFRILRNLDPKHLLIAARVSHAWNKLSSHNEVWKAKCDQVNIAVPIPENEVRWKDIYRDNKFLKRNWNSGQCKETDLKGHSAKVLSVVHDGNNRLASGSKDTTIKLWDAKSGHLLQTLKGHTKGVWCLQFFTENLLVSGSFDNTIKVWNLRTGSCSRTLYGHNGAVWAMVRKKNLLASASQDRTAKLWHIGRCMLLHTLSGHAQAVFCIDMDDNCTIVITGSADRSIRIWSTETGRHMKVIWASQTTSIMSLSYHHGYIACSVGEIISLWRVDTGVCVRTFDEHEKRVESLNVRVDDTSDPDNPSGLLVSAGQDGHIKYWDILKGKCKHTLRGHSTQINCIVCDKTKIVSASYDNKLRVWDFNTVV